MCKITAKLSRQCSRRHPSRRFLRDLLPRTCGLYHNAKRPQNFLKPPRLTLSLFPCSIHNLFCLFTTFLLSNSQVTSFRTPTLKSKHPFVTRAFCYQISSRLLAHDSCCLDVSMLNYFVNISKPTSSKLMNRD